MPQCRAYGVELIVVRASRAQGKTAELFNRAIAGCTVVVAPGAADLPRLRGLGLGAATGEWVALTEDHCVPDRAWLQALLTAAAPDVEVLGGSMGNAKRARATDCGAFFSEYGVYGAQQSATQQDSPPLITGANVAYHRRIVSDVTDWSMNGSWENVIHDRLYAAGSRFRLVPEAHVRQNLHYGVREFCRNRYEHGRVYATNRVRGQPIWRRVMYAAAVFALPLLLLMRIARAADPEERFTFWRAIPATLTFLAAWSAGEAVGYLLGSVAE